MNLVTTDDVKEYLHIPYDDDDTLISTQIQSGYDYLANAVENFDKLQSSDEAFSRQADAWVLTQWMPSAYDEREGMHSDAPSLNYTARSMLTALQMTEYEEEEETTSD